MKAQQLRSPGRASVKRRGRPGSTCTASRRFGRVAPRTHRPRAAGDVVAASDSAAPVVASDAAPEVAPVAQATVQRYYDAWNRGDLDTVLDCFADDAVYHDTVYLEPLFGKRAIGAYLEKFRGLDGLQKLTFTVTEYSGNDSSCGVAWHCEVAGGLMPFSRGCSLYCVNDVGQITWGRDCVEAAPPKPGDSTLSGLQVLVPLIERIGPDRSDPARLTEMPLQSAAVWAFYAGYIGWLFFSTTAPGAPVWQTSPETLEALAHESLNFFYVNNAMHALGITLIPDIAVHPVDEALFNLGCAWSMLWLPLMLAGRPGGPRVERVLPQWLGTMMLFNVFFIPYLAQRAAPGPHETRLSAAERTDASLSQAAAAAAMAKVPEGSVQGGPPGSTDGSGSGPSGAGWRVMGGVGMVVGAVSLGWCIAGRPEFGGLGERAAFAADALQTNRVFYAYCVDSVLYWVWQVWLLGQLGAPSAYRAVPFFGLASWLLVGAPRKAAT